MQNTLESKTDVALTVYTLLANSVVHYKWAEIVNPSCSVLTFLT